jgi:hypothetical protein
MNPRRFATITAVLCGTAGISWFVAFGSAGIENTAAPTLDRLAPFHTADFKLTDAPLPAAMGNAGVGNVEAARAAGLVRGAPTDRTAASDEPRSIDGPALANSSEMVPPEKPPVQVATASMPMIPKNTKDAVSSIDVLDECLEGCIDRYLWALYQRTPKEDTIKVQELRNVTIKRKSKAVTVTKSFTKLVDEDFTWKALASGLLHGTRPMRKRQHKV